MIMQKTWVQSWHHQLEGGDRGDCLPLPKPVTFLFFFFHSTICSPYDFWHPPHTFPPDFPSLLQNRLLLWQILNQVYQKEGGLFSDLRLLIFFLNYKWLLIPINKYWFFKIIQESHSTWNMLTMYLFWARTNTGFDYEKWIPTLSILKLNPTFTWIYFKRSHKK